MIQSSSPVLLSEGAGPGKDEVLDEERGMTSAVVEVCEEALVVRDMSVAFIREAFPRPVGTVGGPLGLVIVAMSLRGVKR